jgi:type III secretion protein J
VQARTRNTIVVSVTVATVLVAGCSRRTVLEKLPRREADRCSVALRAAGVDASIEGAGDESVVTVGGDDADFRTALQVLDDHGLPRRAAPGFETESASLIPSPSEDRARYIKGLSGEIETLLESVDGVVTAEALVSLPERRPLAPAADPASASVVLSFAGLECPVADTEVRDIVVRSIGADISTDRVSVVSKPVIRAVPLPPVVRYQRDRTVELAFLACVLLLAGLEVVTIWRLRLHRRSRLQEDARV